MLEPQQQPVPVQVPTAETLGVNDILSEAAKANANTTQLQAQPQALQTFLQPYQQASGDIWSAQQAKLQANLGDTLQQLNQKLYGANVGVQSGIGQDNISRLMKEQTTQLAPYAQELAGKTTLQGISDYLNQLNRGGTTALGVPTLEATQVANQAAQFEKSYGLDVTRTTNQAAQFAQNYGLDVAKMSQQDKQFTDTLANTKNEFMANQANWSSQFEQDKLNFGQEIALKNLQVTNQAAQFAQNYGLDVTKLSTQDKQFTSSLDQQQAEFKQNQLNWTDKFNQDKGQLDTQMSQWESTFNENKRQFNSQIEMTGKEFALKQAQMLLPSIFDGTITGDSAKNLLATLGISPDSFTKPDKRAEQIKEITAAFIAKGDPVDYTKMNDWLSALGYAKVTKAEVVKVQGLSTLSSIMTPGFGQSSNADVKAMEGFGLESKYEDRPITGDWFNRREWRTIIPDTPKNRELFDSKYGTDAAFTTFVDSKIKGV